MMVALVGTGCSKKEAPEPKTYKFDPLDGQSSATGATKETESANTAPVKPSGDVDESDAPKTKKEKKSAHKSDDSTASTSGTKYIVQIAAFTKKENAEQLLNTLKGKNYPVFIKHLDHKDFGQMFLVRLPPTTDRVEAEKLLAQLKKSDQLTPTIIVPKE